MRSLKAYTLVGSAVLFGVEVGWRWARSITR